MNKKYSNINSFWGYLIIEELIRNGIDYFCISPGSRSTPLAVAVAGNKKARSIICYDERGAAFHALGYAKSTGNPAVLICTSGTAVANYYPAVIEASQTGTPLIILSADRPPELRDTGANQTIDQIKIFGDNVKWFFDLPAPDIKIKPAFLLTTIDQGIHQSTLDKKGPVHINCMFREPLEPTKDELPSEYITKISDWKSGVTQYTQIVTGTLKINPDDLEKLAEILNSARCGILSIGRLNTQKQKNDVKNLAEKIGWPVFADITSGLRSSSRLTNLITHFDQILLKKDISQILNPDILLHVGAPLTSKRFIKFTAALKNISYVQITDDQQRNDPEHSVTHSFRGTVSQTCRDLMPILNPKRNEKLELLISYNKKISEIVNGLSTEQPKINEISVARIISRILPRNHILFLGNSMPIRDFDMFADFSYSLVCVGSNRGASGIDGTLATATGFATGQQKPLTIVLGDLALIHDLNSLFLVNMIDQQIILIVINNHGGGIFSFLPIAEFDQVFEQYFGTPHQLNFQQAAKLFGIDYSNPQTNEELVDVYKKYARNKKSLVIEIFTDRQENSDLHKHIQNTIIANL